MHYPLSQQPIFADATALGTYPQREELAPSVNHHTPAQTNQMLPARAEGVQIKRLKHAPYSSHSSPMTPSQTTGPPYSQQITLALHLVLILLLVDLQQLYRMAARLNHVKSRQEKLIVVVILHPIDQLHRHHVDFIYNLM